MSCHDFICLTETWLAAHDKPNVFPAHTYYSACRALRDGPGRHSGGVGVFVSSCVHKHIQFVKAADDASYLWLKLKDVVLGCPEVYFAVCYMPQKKGFMNHQKITSATPCPYECLQNDVLDYQSRGAQILICGDFNARTAEEPDFVRTAELQPFLPTAPDDEELPDYIPQMRNCDKVAPGSQTWGPELLGFCQQNNLLILNGRTVGDECGQCTFQSARGKSTVDYFIASVHCMTAAKSLHVLEEAAHYGSDHNPLFLHVACDTVQLARSSHPSAACEARVRYDVQRAEAYQEALASLLQQHFIPFSLMLTCWPPNL